MRVGRSAPFAKQMLDPCMLPHCELHPTEGENLAILAQLLGTGSGAIFAIVRALDQDNG